MEDFLAVALGEISVKKSLEIKKSVEGFTKQLLEESLEKLLEETLVEFIMLAKVL